MNPERKLNVPPSLAEIHGRPIDLWDGLRPIKHFPAKDSGQTLCEDV